MLWFCFLITCFFIADGRSDAVSGKALEWHTECIRLALDPNLRPQSAGEGKEEKRPGLDRETVRTEAIRRWADEEADGDSQESEDEEEERRNDRHVQLTNDAENDVASLALLNGT